MTQIPKNISEDLRQSLVELDRMDVESDSAGNYIDAMRKRIEESASIPPIKTGFSRLDRELDGGLYAGLYIIGAISSLGKTDFALQIADHIAQSGRDVIIFSLEMARFELMARTVSRLSLLQVLEENKEMTLPKTVRGILDGSRYSKYSEEEKALIDNSFRMYQDFANHIIINEGVGDVTADKIRAYVDTMIELIHADPGKKPVVIVDYLQIIAPDDVRATDKQNMDKAVLELKRISRDYDIPVIAISSLNRANYTEKVSMQALKESGGIEYGSDVIIGLQLEGAGKSSFDVDEAKAKNPREIEAVILKNRNGKTGETVKLNYYPMFHFMGDYD